MTDGLSLAFDPRKEEIIGDKLIHATGRFLNRHPQLRRFVVPGVGDSRPHDTLYRVGDEIAIGKRADIVYTVL